MATKNEISAYIPQVDSVESVKDLVQNLSSINLPKVGPKEQNAWQILCRAVLEKAAGRMEPRHISILAGVIGRSFPTEKQMTAVLQSVKTYAPDLVYMVEEDG